MNLKKTNSPHFHLPYSASKLVLILWLRTQKNLHIKYLVTLLNLLRHSQECINKTPKNTCKVQKNVGTSTKMPLNSLKPLRIAISHSNGMLRNVKLSWRSLCLVLREVTCAWKRYKELVLQMSISNTKLNQPLKRTRMLFKLLIKSAQDCQ